jgi:hypothetical protein
MAGSDASGRGAHLWRRSSSEVPELTRDDGVRPWRGSSPRAGGACPGRARGRRARPRLRPVGAHANDRIQSLGMRMKDKYD